MSSSTVGAESDTWSADDVVVAGIRSCRATDDATRSVPIRSLRPADSPRLAGEQIDHLRALATVRTELLPPILVHEPTMRVIDGMHRLRAAELRGETTIKCDFFSGDEDLAFVLAVEANVSHGLPLSVADRSAAASRILREHGEWSNRTVAAIAGLAPSTVGEIRAREYGHATEGAVRVGRDGRVRPLSTANSRRLASEIIAQRPDASLREVAKAAGISTATVRDVRRRMARGENPVPAGMRPDEGQTRRATTASRPAPERSSILAKLKGDPSLRFTGTGRELVRWLEVHSSGLDGWAAVLDSVPPHSSYVVAELARWCSQRWLEVANHLRDQAKQMPTEFV